MAAALDTMLGGAMEGGLKRKRGSGEAVEPILPVAPAPKRRGSRAPAKRLNAILFAGDVPFPEGTPGNYADYLNLSAGDMPCPEVSPDYLKEMISGFPFSKIATQDARGSATAPRTTYPLFNDWWYEVVPGNVDQVKKRPAKTVTEKPPPTQPGPESGHKKEKDKPPTGKKRGVSHKKEKDKPPTGKKRGVSGQFWDQPTVHGWLKSEGLTSQALLDAHSKREGGLPAGMPAQPVAFFQRRRTTTLTSAEFWKR